MERKNIIIASLWMVGISLALFFLPLINGLVGGAVGGYKAGTWKRGLVASLLPAAVLAVLLWGVLAWFEAPVVGFVTGAAVGILVLLADVGLVIGAAVGGYLAQSSERRELPGAQGPGVPAART